MPINQPIEYQLAEAEFHKASSIQEKLAAAKNMLSKLHKHKSTENLEKELKNRIAKYKELVEKEKKSKKGKSTGIKKEGAARIVILGKTNTGKSTLLRELTNAKVEIKPFPFTTKKPELGTLDYKGIKLQIIEIPAIFEDYYKSPDGLKFLAIVRESDLAIIMQDSKFILSELKKVDITIPYIEFSKNNLKDKIWSKLNLIKVYTKQPGKEKDCPPIALKKDSTIKDLASKLHKDFLTKFKFARVWGKSAKFPGQYQGLEHELEDDDVVEFHIR